MNLIILCIGIIFAGVAWYLDQPWFSWIVLGLTIVLFVARMRRNMRNPKVQKAIREKVKNIEKKYGLLAYNDTIENAVRGTAVINTIKDIGEKFRQTFTILLLELQVEGMNSRNFTTSIRRIIPDELLPQFQPGKQMNVIFDNNQPEESVMFVSCTTPEGYVINFSDYPVRS